MQEKKRKHRTNRNKKEKNNAKKKWRYNRYMERNAKKAKNMSSIT